MPHEETVIPFQKELPFEVNVDQLHPFPHHPFQVRQDEELYKLADSIREHGPAEPILCRPSPEGEGYQIISGHRRAEACRLAGIENIPVSVREMDDDLAILIMVDANLHREKILPSDTDLNKKQYVFIREKDKTCHVVAQCVALHLRLKLVLIAE